jgi:hypothetical protein
MPETVTGLPAGYRTTSAKIMRILAMATGTLAAVQFALAGYGAFSGLNKHDRWGGHETLGTVIGAFSLLVLAAAVVSRPGRRPLIGAAVLFVLAGPIQPILAGLGKDHGAWWGALHALAGVAILAICGLASQKIAVTPSEPAPA